LFEGYLYFNSDHSNITAIAIIFRGLPIAMVCDNCIKKQQEFLLRGFVANVQLPCYCNKVVTTSTAYPAWRESRHTSSNDFPMYQDPKKSSGFPMYQDPKKSSGFPMYQEPKKQITNVHMVDPDEDMQKAIAMSLSTLPMEPVISISITPTHAVAASAPDASLLNKNGDKIQLYKIIA